ncbi:hypothetical protein FA15DRAFT_671629 [Coprinopsis marcescibilis]|uniref:C2H2-type domain-containing protein n=1 Tax=Coprinopsis marcescibilis TaxID=230819 RepID=A0A5C3KPS7_COPMA|nr:hypothetical protein FA15DRAFT_671629 [Coprinopsis marcescibilis]
MFSNTEDQESPQLFSCRWGWCPHSFANDSDLTHHVIAEHVRKAKPVRRGELPLILRAEQGLGESLPSLELLGGHSQCKNHEPGAHVVSNKLDIADSQPLIEPSSSLPSPPRSNHASSVSPQVQSTKSLPEATAMELTPSVQLSITRDVKNNQGSVFATPLSARFYTSDRALTPSFASLSSPNKPSTLSVNPVIPNLETVLAAVGRGKKRKQRDSEPNTPHRQLPYSASIDSNFSTGSSGIVANHLTQSRDMDVDEEDDFVRYINIDQLADGSTQLTESNPYGGDTFHIKKTLSQIKASQLADVTLSRSQSSTIGSQDPFSSSNLEPPPPAQKPRSSSPPSLSPEGQMELDISSPTKASRPPSPVATTMPQQAWYGVPHRSTKFKFAASGGAITPATEEQKPRVFKFQSGSVPSLNQPILPAPNAGGSHTRVGKDGGLGHISDSQSCSSQEQSTGREEDSSQESNSQNSSLESQEPYYPPLQTQAPYDSQSMDF